jgi:hypothetical protein
MNDNDTPNEVPDDLDAWIPSIRACAKSTSYQHYLELMRQEEADYLEYGLTDAEHFANCEELGS